MPAALRLHLLHRHELRLERWTHDALARPYWRLYWNHAPGWTVTWPGGELPLLPSRVLLVEPDTVFHGHGARPATHFFLHFTIDGLPAPARGSVSSFPRDAVLTALIEAARPAAAGEPGDLAGAALALHAVARLPRGRLAAPAYGPAVAAALARLDAAPGAIAGTAALSRAAGMHPTAFIRRFRAETGTTPGAWQARRRIEAACLALETGDEPIDAIAERFGFCDRNHFTRAFARLRGIGPAAYRRLARRGNA